MSGQRDSRSVSKLVSNVPRRRLFFRAQMILSGQELECTYVFLQRGFHSVPVTDFTPLIWK
jgi:hypothetical protein